MVLKKSYADTRRFSETLNALKRSFSQTKQTKLVFGFCFSDNALSYSSKQTHFQTFFSIDFHWQIKISQKMSDEIGPGTTFWSPVHS